MSDEHEPKAPIERVMSFPVPWASTQLAAPNICLRSALFGVSKRGRRELKNETLASVNGYTVVYSGERLDQFDEDVWLTALDHSKNFGLGAKAPITLRGIAQRVGIGGGGKDVERVRKSLERMIHGTVTLHAGPDHEFMGHLVANFKREHDEYVIRLDPDLVGLFARDQFTLVDAKQRMALDSYLAKWLHGFVRSHIAVFPYKVSTIRKLCGSETKELKHFRADLRSALRELEEKGLVNAWEIDADDLVHIGHDGSASQAKRLSKSAGSDRRAGSDRPNTAGSDHPKGAGSDRPTTAGSDRPKPVERGFSPTAVRVLTDQSAGSDRPTLSNTSEQNSKQAPSLFDRLFRRNRA